MLSPPLPPPPPIDCAMTPIAPSPAVVISPALPSPTVPAVLPEPPLPPTEAESEMDGGLSPRVAPFADVRDVGALLQRAGFALPVTDSDRLTVRYGDVFAPMRDLRAMGATNPLMARRRVPLKRSTLLRMAAIYHERFSDADGRIRATFQVITLSGWTPHESQQKPLKPGSAKARLADALNAIEMPTGDKPSG